MAIIKDRSKSQTGTAALVALALGTSLTEPEMQHDFQESFPKHSSGRLDLDPDLSHTPYTITAVVDQVDGRNVPELMPRQHAGEMEARYYLRGRKTPLEYVIDEDELDSLAQLDK